MPHPRQSNRAFGFSFALFLTVLSTIGWFVFDRQPYWPLGFAALSFLLALIMPWVLLPLNLIWTQLHRVLRFILNNVFLGLFYYLVICPASLVMRLFGFDPMHRRLRRGAAESYWTDVERHADSGTLREMF